MPKLEVPRNEIERSRIVDAIKAQPDILESLNNIFGKGRKKQRIYSEPYAAKLNCTADVLKQAWQKIQYEEKKKTDDPNETRPKSNSSSLTEPRKTRLSVRLQSLETSTSIASSIVSESVGSSICGESSQAEDKQQQASRDNIYSILEDSINFEDPLTSQQPSLADNEEQDAMNDNELGISATTYHQGFDNIEFLDHPCSTTTLPSFQGFNTKKTQTLRFSEPIQTTFISDADNSTIVNNSATKQASIINCDKEVFVSQPIKAHVEEPIRIFFESMALTVMKFPQHLQASIKVKVSNIVHNLEYELFSPHTIHDNVLTVGV